MSERHVEGANIYICKWKQIKLLLHQDNSAVSNPTRHGSWVFLQLQLLRFLYADSAGRYSLSDAKPSVKKEALNEKVARNGSESLHLA